MVDWDMPIEAVNKETGAVVPMTFQECDNGRTWWLTNECPDPATTNSYWNEDGSDRCHHNKWYIRNRVQERPETPPVAFNFVNKSYRDPGVDISEYFFTVKGTLIPEGFGEVLRHTAIGSDVTSIVVVDNFTLKVATASGLQFAMQITEARYGA